MLVELIWGVDSSLTPTASSRLGVRGSDSGNRRRSKGNHRQVSSLLFRKRNRRCHSQSETFFFLSCRRIRTNSSDGSYFFFCRTKHTHELQYVRSIFPQSQSILTIRVWSVIHIHTHTHTHTHALIYVSWSIIYFYIFVYKSIIVYIDYPLVRRSRSDDLTVRVCDK
jgi:hypothetical protein